MLNSTRPHAITFTNSNNQHNLVPSFDITPSIQTDHVAITLDRVFGRWIVLFWKTMSIYKLCFIEDIPIWLAQGRKDLSDVRVIWDWLK